MQICVLDNESAKQSSTLAECALTVLWYGVVRDYEAISYQFTPTFFTSHKRSQISETRMHYTMCWVLPLFI